MLHFALAYVVNQVVTALYEMNQNAIDTRRNARDFFTSEGKSFFETTLDVAESIIISSVFCLCPSWETAPDDPLFVSTTLAASESFLSLTVNITMRRAAIIMRLTIIKIGR